MAGEVAAGGLAHLLRHQARRGCALIALLPQRADQFKAIAASVQLLHAIAHRVGAVRQRAQHAVGAAGAGGARGFAIVLRGHGAARGFRVGKHRSAARRLEGTLDKGRAVGELKVLGHALAGGGVVHRQAVADHHVEHGAQVRGLIQLADDAAVDAAIGRGIVTVGVDDFVERVAVAGAVEQQDALHRRLHASQHGDLLGQVAVALAHAHGVDDHQVLLGQRRQREAQVGRVLDRMHGHAKDVAVDAQLLVRANPERVGGQERQAFRAVLEHEARGKLGGGGGLAHAGGTHQRQHAALGEERIFVVQHRHLAPKLLADPGHGGGPVMAQRQVTQQRTGELPGEASGH